MQCEQCKFHALGNCRRYPREMAVKPDYWCGEYKAKGSAKQQSMFPDAPYTLPEWVPLPEWNAYIEMRKRIKKPPTDKAVAMLVETLKKLVRDGDDPAEVLNQSTQNNYTGIFTVRGKNGNRKQSPLADMRDAWQSVIEESNQRQQDKLGQLRISEGNTPASPLRIEADPDLF